jgi:hypothetical protein
MEPKNEKRIIFILLFISVFLFLAFGLFHLTKFETADEHLWKYGRIKQYWQSIENRDWEKTYINDKPGITVALFSGFGLLLEPNPENHKISDPSLTQNGLFNLYDTKKTDFINLIFRLPVLIVSALSFFLFFYLAWKASNSLWFSLFIVMFLAMNPVLVGISQIVNPDSFFWIFGGLSVFSFLALLKTQEKKFVVITGLLTGFALLSKYTAITLFLFYFLALIGKIIFKDPGDSAGEKNYRAAARMFFHVFSIFIISLAAFSVFLPAVFVKPEYLTKGISQFIGAKDFVWLAAGIILVLATSAYWKKTAERIFEALAGKKEIILKIICFVFLLVMLIIFINTWTGQKIIPFDKLRDAAYANEPKNFSFKPFLKNDSAFLKNVKLFLMEPYFFIFSLTPLSLLLILSFPAKFFFRKIKDCFSFILFSAVSFFLIYFVLTVFAGVVANVRYSILLYPLFALLFAAAIFEFAEKAGKNRTKYFLPAALAILLFGTFSLWVTRPFYFGYANFMLPKEFTITQSWGHGTYEAAQYLNSLPGAENKVIWSNTNTICMFFRGKCLEGRKIDLDVAKPDYFVLSKRGELKADRGFIFTNPDFKGKSGSYYYENLKTNYVWALFMDGREENYIKIVKFEN